MPRRPLSLLDGTRLDARGLEWDGWKGKILKIYDKGQGLHDARRLTFSTIRRMDVNEAGPALSF